MPLCTCCLFTVYTKVTEGQAAVRCADATMKMSTPGLHTEGFPVAGETMNGCDV